VPINSLFSINTITDESYFLFSTIVKIGKSIEINVKDRKKEKEKAEPSHFKINTILRGKQEKTWPVLESIVERARNEGKSQNFLCVFPLLFLVFILKINRVFIK